MKSTFVRTGACLALLIAAAFPSHATQPVACDSLLGSFIEGATITTAQLNAATATLPEHCEVVGAINQRTGIDGQPYAIKLHLRMPTAWNERFFYQGGGGTDGNLGNADARADSAGLRGGVHRQRARQRGQQHAARGLVPVRLRPAGAQRLRLQRARARGRGGQGDLQEVLPQAGRSTRTSSAAPRAAARA